MNKNQYVVSVRVIAIGLALLGMLWGYQSSKASLEHSTISAYEEELASDIKALIADKGDASMAIAITLSENPQIKTALQKNNEPINFNFKKISALLTENTYFNNVWLQLIDAQGVSLLRSYSPKKGDSLLKVRPDIGDILAEPKPTRTLSVGKFTLSIKSSVPIFDEQQLLGLIEVISPFGVLAKSLVKATKVDSIILADKRFRKQLTNAPSDMFIDDYYVVNEGSTAPAMAILSKLGAKGIEGFDGYQIHENTIVERHLIHNNRGQVIAYWFTFSNKDLINFSEVKRVLIGYVYGIMIFLMLLIILLIVHYFKRQSDGRRHYYRQIIDSASDIIIVTNRNGMVDVNKHFFYFYSEFTTLDEFLEKYTGICKTFEKENGFLQASMEGEYWLDYVLKNRNIVHKVKIMKADQAHYFVVKVREMKGRSEPLFNVLLQDITAQEVYKNKLERLSQTDALTGIGNRLYFNQSLAAEIQRSHRYDHNLSLVMFDIDYFKKVNDTYGHDVGDQVLIELASQIQRQLRETDILCRFGGEEFIIILPETRIAEAQRMAERMRVAIEVLSFDEFPTPLTLSFGVAQMKKWDSEKTLFKRVDKALYQAKDLGRNQVVPAI